jgi:proline dehydrogenase
MARSAQLTGIPAVDFNNTELAFSAKSNQELLRTYRLYKLIDSPFLTRIGPPMLRIALKLHLPVVGIIRKTLFSMFCGGISLKDSVNTTEFLAGHNMLSILDYAVEGERSEKGFDRTRDQIIATLTHASQRKEIPFIACKLTGLGDTNLMTRVQKGEELSGENQKRFEAFRQRVRAICEVASSYSMPVFIDAEESWFQDVFDRLAEEMMETYNKEKVIVATTLQMYRWDRLQYLRDLIKQCKEKGYIAGVKLVRGAYLEKETLRAKEMGYKNPMQPDKESTDRDFDAALKLCIDHIDHIETCAGTHNAKSCLYLVDLMREKGIPPEHPHVLFSQLLGMSDDISFNLAHAGFNVAKYVPYGPVKSVMPYLMRRAQENTAIAGQSSRELELLKKEMKRRNL